MLCIQYFQYFFKEKKNNNKQRMRNKKNNKPANWSTLSLTDNSIQIIFTEHPQAIGHYKKKVIESQDIFVHL